jgi:protein-tyrosine sulfotransferase
MQGMRFLRSIIAALGIGRRADRFTGGPRPGFEPIVLGGCGRSGTTLLRMMLDSHPRISCGPESSVFRRRAIDPDALADRFGLARGAVRAIDDTAVSRPAFIEAFATLCLQEAGKARWAEKTPRNISRIGAIFRFFPAAHFVHVLRDGRDVACSLRTHPRHEVVDGRLVPLDTWKPLAACARRWRDDIECSRPWWSDPRFHTLRYEDLVRDPGSVLRRLMIFLGEPWADVMLAYAGDGPSSRDVTRFAQSPEAIGAVSAASIGRWQRDFNANDRRTFKRIAGPLLIELGYAKNESW